MILITLFVMSLLIASMPIPRRLGVRKLRVLIPVKLMALAFILTYGLDYI